MQDVLEIALTGMQQELLRLERVANNLANTTTPAYKSELAAPSDGRSFADHLEGKRGAWASAPQVFTDTRPGTLKMTGRALDLALPGDGYFEISTGHGLAYTRLGSFQLDAQGRMLTATGQPVMGKGGEIRLSAPNPAIDANGKISENGRFIDQIRILKFDRPAALHRLGQGLFGVSSLAGRGKDMADGEIRLRQGALENSNVNSLHEMVELSRTMRRFESMQKLAQGYDEIIGLAIRKMAEP